MKKKFEKKHLLYAACALVVIGIMASFTALVAVPSVKRNAVKIAKNELFENYYSFPEDGMITTKNGFGNNEENSLLYVKAAFQNDADCIEVDVCFDEDGVPYIAESPEKIDENTMPLEYLLSFVNEKINTSSQRTHSINLHLTDASGIEKIDELVKHYKMEDVCFLTGVNINQASYIRQNCSIPFYLDYEIKKSKVKDTEYASQVVNQISQSGAVGINCTADAFSEILSTMLKENWLKISFYDVESETEIINALRFSPNQIITENPLSVRSILIEWNANAPSSDIIPS